MGSASRSQQGSVLPERGSERDRAVDTESYVLLRRWRSLTEGARETKRSYTRTEMSATSCLKMCDIQSSRVDAIASRVWGSTLSRFLMLWNLAHLQQVVGEHEGHHGLHHRHRPRHHAGIVPPLRTRRTVGTARVIGVKGYTMPIDTDAGVREKCQRPGDCGDASSQGTAQLGSAGCVAASVSNRTSDASFRQREKLNVAHVQLHPLRVTTVAGPPLPPPLLLGGSVAFTQGLQQPWTDEPTTPDSLLEK